MTTAVPTTASSTIMKLGRVDVVVKSIGANATTIPLTALAKSDETLGVPQVNILAMHWVSSQTSDKITISRNGVVQYYLQGSGDLDFNGFLDAQNNTSDIVVDMGVTGTLILELRKVAGYQEPDQQHNPH